MRVARRVYRSRPRQFAQFASKAVVLRFYTSGLWAGPVAFCTIKAGVQISDCDEIRRVRSNQDPYLLKAFAAEIKARRGALGLNQEQLARICPLNRTFIAKLELGQTSPSLTTLFRLAVGLEVDPEDLIVSTKKRYRKELRSAIEK